MHILDVIIFSILNNINKRKYLSYNFQANNIFVLHQVSQP